MRNSAAILSADAVGQTGLMGPRLVRPSFLHLVTSHELRELKVALSNGQVPADFEAKLLRLAEGDLLRRTIAQHCRLWIVLLQSVYNGSFQEASPAECQSLLRVLAYVRKNEDGIPDYRPDGYDDDLQEVKAVAGEFAPLIHTYKSWRLAHQVPGMWAAAAR